jgi:RND family efflux transporter MFP subunit
MRRVFLLAAILAAAAGCGRPEREASGEPAGALTPVEVYVVTAGEAVVRVAATGTVKAREDIPVSAEVGGQVREVPVMVGDGVAAGEPLVLLDDELILLALDQAEAQLLLAEANLETAEASLRRTRTLLEEDDISKADFEAIESAAKAARASHMSAEAGRASAERQLRNTRVPSPIDGIVAFVYVEEGHLVAPGMPVARVVDDRVVEVEIGLSEDQVVDVRTGRGADVRVRALPGEVFEGRVEYVGPSADDIAKTYPVRVVVQNAARRLRSGMVAEVTVDAKRFDGVIVIERDWVFDRFGEPAVFVATDSTAVVRKVTLGKVIGDGVVVRSGLDPGDRVISFGYDQLTDNARIQIKNSP